MRFQVLGRKAVKYIDPQVNHIIISITDPETQPAEFTENNNCKGVLRYQYYDFSKCPNSLVNPDRDFMHPKYCNIFSRKHAEEILRFVSEQINSIELIICHCEMGISRSAGTAAALARIINGDDEIFFYRHHPNFLVYSTILRTYEEIKDSLKLKRQ